MIRIHFKGDGTHRLKAVLLAQCVVGFLEKLGNVWPQYCDFLFVKLYFEVRCVETVEVLKTIQQSERIHGPDVEAVSLVRLIESCLAFVFLPDSHEVHPKGAHRIPISWIEIQSFSREVDSLLIQTQ